MSSNELPCAPGTSNTTRKLQYSVNSLDSECAYSMQATTSRMPLKKKLLTNSKKNIMYSHRYEDKSMPIRPRRRSKSAAAAGSCANGYSAPSFFAMIIPESKDRSCPFPGVIADPAKYTTLSWMPYQQHNHRSATKPTSSCHRGAYVPEAAATTRCSSPGFGLSGWGAPLGQ